MYEYKLINLNDLRGYSDDDIKKYLRYNGVRKFDECDIASLKIIIEKLETTCLPDFNVSYIVDRLDKEFDLVKLDESRIINIELKSSHRDVTQCIENYKLLKNEYDNREITVYCYESDNDHIYMLDHKDRKFIKTSFKKLNDELSKISSGIKLNININVDSVYINPDFFLEKKYNLSSSQRLMKSQIIQSNKKVNVIGGRAGCGKSLLALDMYDYYLNVENKKVQYLTPFKLNDVINIKLRKQIDMKTVKDFISKDEDVDIIIVDEAQRLKPADILVLPEKVKEKIVLIGDINQNIDFESGFESLYNDRANNFVQNMKQLIRTDDTFEIFARKILNISDKGFKHKKINKNKIRILMYGEEIPDLSDYVFIEPSKSLYFRDCTYTCPNKKCLIISGKCKNTKEPHTVISSEYKNVIMFFCNGYDIKDDNIVKVSDLCTGKLSSQIYAIVTRAIDNLIIVTDNIVLYNYLMGKLEEM